jgi:hypothetical protein
MDQRIELRQPPGPCLGRCDVARKRRCADAADRATAHLMSATDQLPHHGSADQSCPTKHKDVQLAVSVWKRAHIVGSLQSTDMLRRNVRTQNRLNRTRPEKNSSQSYFSSLRLSPRFSPASDVVPFSGLILSDFRSLDTSIINNAANPAASGE